MTFPNDFVPLEISKMNHDDAMEYCTLILNMPLSEAELMYSVVIGKGGDVVEPTLTMEQLRQKNKNLDIMPA